MPRKYNVNICRSGETSTNHIVPTIDNSAAGSYTCSMNILAVVSSASTGYVVTAKGLFVDKVYEICLYLLH